MVIPPTHMSGAPNVTSGTILKKLNEKNQEARNVIKTACYAFAAVIAINLVLLLLPAALPGNSLPGPILHS